MVTTPDPITLHRTCAELASAGVEHLAVEASSHGLHQHRLDGLVLRAAAFSNISRDHYDYHGDAAAYYATCDRQTETPAAASAPAPHEDFGSFGAGATARALGY